MVRGSFGNWRVVGGSVVGVFNKTHACHPFCELPGVNDCTNETHELVRLIMREEELEFHSNTAEPKKSFYFHQKKHPSTSTLILREYLIRATQTLYCTDISLTGKKFVETKFLQWKFLQFQSLFPKPILRY